MACQLYIFLDSMANRGADWHSGLTSKQSLDTRLRQDGRTVFKIKRLGWPVLIAVSPPGPGKCDSLFLVYVNFWLKSTTIVGYAWGKSGRGNRL